LDENFIQKKVDRIKFLADLHRRVLRFNTQLKHGDEITPIGLNPIGVHLIDQELEAKF
jgi:hypothetical protein